MADATFPRYQAAIPWLCFALIAACWVVDLLTPQLFVAAVLLNGPIALSGLALRGRLTIVLVLLSEVANIAAGYVNGIQEGYHWQAVAIGDRVLSGASFLLVGYLTVKAQEFARSAGASRERERRAEAEASLRAALDAVRASLNVELVMRTAVRECVHLLGAQSARLIVRRSTLRVPDTYRFAAGGADVGLERRAMDPHVASLVQRVLDRGHADRVGLDDAIARSVIEAAGAQAALVAPLVEGDMRAVLLLFGGADAFDAESERMLQAFSDGAAVALRQARLFTQLGEQNEAVAEQKNALQERSRVIRDLVYALAHDLRTPLAAARVTMQQALDGAYGPLPDAYRDILRSTLSSNDDVRRLVETLLLVARYESGEASTLREPVDMRTQVERVVDELRPLALSKNVTLTPSIAGLPAIVEGDASELRRAITNLVANAIAATPAGGAVSLRADGEAEQVRIDIEDDGYGVPVERRALLFERFGGGGGMGSGTGLGLYIVRRIVEHHGGSIAYRPREPKGSVFTVTFPRAGQA